MTYKAYVIDKCTKEALFIEDSYNTKIEFKKSLVSNGYTVRRIEVKEVYDYVLDNTNAESRDFAKARKLFLRRD